MGRISASTVAALALIVVVLVPSLRDVRDGSSGNEDQSRRSLQAREDDQQPSQQQLSGVCDAGAWNPTRALFQFQPDPGMICPFQEPIPVLRYPTGIVANEADHYFRDGIKKSDCFYETNSVEADVWLLDSMSIKRYQGGCETIQKLLDERVQVSCPDSTSGCFLPYLKVIQIDYADFATDEHFCFLADLDRTVPKENLVYYKRSQVQGRKGYGWTMGHIMNFTRPFNDTSDSSLPVRHTVYGVRSDIVLEVNRQLAANLSTELPNSTKYPLNPVFLDRPGGVRYFWHYLRRQCRRDCLGTRLRSGIGERLRSVRVESNETVDIRMAGDGGSAGREHANEEYVRDMLQYKIVVVAQRDEYEGMYRLMEAFAGGALVIADAMLLPPKYMVDGEHYVVYHSHDDMHDKVLYYLKCPGERLRIANNGWKMAQNHYRSYHMMENIILEEADLRR